MTYLALARKWRPKIFTEVMGQTHVVTALSNALNSGRVHHAFLFTGTRGVGKTTIARIFAKSLNCEQGMSATPCGECSICRNIDTGSFIDLIEVDAASRTGIDDMRELLDNIQYAPTQGRVKVYLIDEIHMLSKSSFNALLKTLEEPPEHVKFLFATTDPQKLPVTVLSRCLQFNLKALQPDEISRQISHILDAEGIDFDETGVDLVSRAADGSLRDGLSLLEQAISQGGGAVDAESVREMLGTVKASHMDELINAIIHSDAQAALATIHTMATYAADFNAAIDQLLIELHTITLAQVAADSLAYKVTDVEKYQNYAQQISAEDVQLCYQIALIAKRDIVLAPDYRSGFEMAVLRIIAFKPVDKNDLNVEGNVDNISDKSTDKNTANIKTVQSEANSSNSIDSTTAVNTVNAVNAVETESVTPNVVQSTPAKREPQLNTPSEATNPSVSQSTAESTILRQAITEPSAPQVQSQGGVTAIVQPKQAPSAPSVNTTTNSVNNVQDNPAQIGAPQTTGAQNLAAHDTGMGNADRQAPSQPKVEPHQAQAIQQHEHQSEHIRRTEPQIRQPAQEINAFEDNAAPLNVVEDEDPHKGLPQAPISEWAGFVEQLQLNGLVRELAMNMACADIQAEPMRLSLDPNFQYMQNASRETAIVEEIRKLRGANYQIQISVETTVNETPAERIKRLSQERQTNTEQQVQDNAAVKSVMQAFDLSIDKSSIKPK